MVSSDILTRFQLFQGLADELLDKIASFSQEEAYQPGDLIFREGDPAEKIYMVVEGKVAVEMKIRLGSTPRKQGTAYVIGDGEILGWSAALWRYPFAVSARCVTNTRVIGIDGASFRHLLEQNPKAGFDLLRKLIRVVWSRYDRTMKTLANILSIASHDLKAPLAAVESYNQVMLSGFVGDITPKQKEVLERNSQRIKELLNLIDNILDISRIDISELDMKPLSLLEVAREAVGTAEALAREKGLELKVSLPESLPPIRGSAVRLQQVLQNLLGNAVKFTPAPGTVALKLEEEDDLIRIEVSDTGVGIPPEELPRIFDDFYRGRQTNTKGAGLGLAICKKIIEAHKGRIWAESPCPETGKGSKFTLTLPKRMDRLSSEVRSEAQVGGGKA